MNGRPDGGFHESRMPECCDTGWVRAETGGGPAARRCACVTGPDARPSVSTGPASRPATATAPSRTSRATTIPTRDALKISQEIHRPTIPDQDIGLLFIGPCGVGKTHLAAAILGELVRTQGGDRAFLRFPRPDPRHPEHLLAATPTGPSPTSSPRSSTCDVLVLDELGAKRSTAWVEETIFYIINHRYNEQKLTIFTSNYPDTADDEDDRAADVQEDRRPWLQEGRRHARRPDRRSVSVRGFTRCARSFDGSGDGLTARRSSRPATSRLLSRASDRVAGLGFRSRARDAQGFEVRPELVGDVSGRSCSKKLPDFLDFVLPLRRLDLEQLLHLRPGDRQAVHVEVVHLRNQADGRFLGPDVAVDPVEDPFAGRACCRRIPARRTCRSRPPGTS